MTYRPRADCKRDDDQVVHDGPSGFALLRKRAPSLCRFPSSRRVEVALKAGEHLPYLAGRLAEVGHGVLNRAVAQAEEWRQLIRVEFLNAGRDVAMSMP